MGGHGAGKGIEIVAAFQQGDDLSARVAVGDAQKLLGDPDEIRHVEANMGERIGPMRIEAGGNDQKIRAEIVDRRQDGAGSNGLK